MTWIGVSLLATAASAIDGRWARRAGLITLAAAALLLAHATKETSLVLVPISVGWLAIELWSSRARETGTRFAAAYVVINLVAAAMFVALRWSYARAGSRKGTYTRAYASTMDGRRRVVRIAAWMLRDFAFMMPLLASPSSSVDAHRHGVDILYASVWTAGWLAVYLPWPATFAYYLLPFTFGAAVLGGTVVGEVWASRGHQHSAVKRRVAWSLLLASGLLWPVAIVNAAVDARVQLAVDRANADLVDFLGGVPSRSRVVVNTTRVNEYLFELPMHLSQIKRRSDIVVEHVAQVSSSGSSTADVFVVTAEMANKPWPTVRVALDEPGVRHDKRSDAMLTPQPSRVPPRAHSPRRAGSTDSSPCHREPSPTLPLPDRSRGHRPRTFSYGCRFTVCAAGAGM